MREDYDDGDENFWERGTYEFEPLEAGFAQGGVLDDVLPGPLLAAAVGATADGDLSGVSDNELLGLMRGARKAGAWLAWAQTMAEAEYASRNLEWDPQQGRQVVNEFAAQEVAQEIPLSGGAARDRLQRSHAARDRLARCLALLNAGQIDDFGMRIIAETTANVSQELAVTADRQIAARAAGLTPGQLRRLCTRVIMTVDPGALENNRRRQRQPSGWRSGRNTPATPASRPGRSQ